MKSVAWLIPVAIVLAGLGCQPQQQPGSGERSHFTHGPMLGRVEAHEMGVWARTVRSGKFAVRYGTGADKLDSLSPAAETRVERDNTGWVHLTGLDSGTRYHYRLVWLEGTEETPGPGGNLPYPAQPPRRAPSPIQSGRTLQLPIRVCLRQQPEYRQSGRLRMEPARLRHHAQRTSGSRQPVADRFRHSQRGLAV